MYTLYKGLKAAKVTSSFSVLSCLSSSSISAFLDSMQGRTKLMLHICYFYVQFSEPVGKIQGLIKHLQRPYLFSCTSKGLEFLKLNSRTFKDFSSML